MYGYPPNFSPYNPMPFYPPAPEPMTYKQYRKMYRKWERDWKEKDKDKKDSGHNHDKKRPHFGVIETFALMSVFGLPVGAGYLLIMNAIAKSLFAMIPH